ncbi:prominin-like protein isoform X1 [Sitodiplosis mosellana]|uniref:prominin-like protein isoform X1 n=1 Tax=Sitodiplosis mosellana TaxID=263140 RepID=UPI002444B436|nr:prominin-like protein isoform X1 [Sitodiplosis mosellana]XP_055325441.1 prominin-like protein isoform X1 [Sitodiplosis mosellana]
MAYKQLKMVPLHTMLIIVGVVLIGALSSMTLATNADLQSPQNTRIIQFRDANFSVWNEKVKYNSTAMTNPKGMEPLYNLTTIILDFFLGKKPVPDGYIHVSNMNVTLGQKVRDHQWVDLVKHYWAILLVVFIAALMIALMPIIGLCVCCCRCAGACGGRSQPFDKKHDTCRRIFLGFFLIVVATGLVFSVIVAFATNYLLQQGIENATTTARYGVSDTQEFLRSTSLQSNHILVKNYDELTDHLELMLMDTAEVVITQLKEKSKAVSLTQLATFVETLPQIEQDLHRMKEITGQLRVNASQLSDGLRGVKRELLLALTKCQRVKACQEVLEEYEIGKLDVNGIDYDQLPDVSEMIASVHDLNSGHTIDSIRRSQHTLENLRDDINRTIYSNIPQVTNSIRKTGTAMRNISSEIQRTLARLSDVTGQTKQHFNTADVYIKEYYIYVYYALLAVCSTLLLVLMCIVCGLLCGICGKRPDGYGDDCCNKGAGARFLILAVTVIFLTTSILLAVGIVIFLGGLILHRGACVPLNNRSDEVFKNYIDPVIDLNTVIYANGQRMKIRSPEIEPLRISQVIDSCHRNNSIYKVLNLRNYYDIYEILTYPDRFEIKSQLQKLVQSVEVPSIEIHVDDAIVRLAQSGLKDFDIDKFTDNLNEEITKRNLNTIAQKLEETATKISSNSEYSDIRTILKNQALHLRVYQEQLVTPMTEQTKEMLILSRRLEENLKFNRSSFKVALEEFIREIKFAQDFINKEGTEFVQKVANELVIGFEEEINAYLNHVVNQTENELGRCGPLANVYKSVVVAGCNRIVNPLNGLWAGIITCILLFLPAIIFSLKLSSLYQKSDPYPGPLVEAEYLYDAYSERDNIPLANSGPKNKRRKNDRRVSSRDRRADYYEDSGSPHHEHHTGSGSREARYSDMAPKHWNGGPPRYQNPPIAPPASEYERPPPYYYPGAPSED